LDCGGWTPLWIFPSTPSLYLKLRQAGALQDTFIAKKRLWQLHNLGQGTHRKPPSSFSSRLRVRPFRKASVRRPADVRRLLPRYVRRGIPTEIHFRIHPLGEAQQVPKSLPWAHWISLRGLPAIFQLRLIGSIIPGPSFANFNAISLYPPGVPSCRSSNLFEPPWTAPSLVRFNDSGLAGQFPLLGHLEAHLSSLRR
jgi:hypothetical protein